MQAAPSSGFAPRKIRVLIVDDSAIVRKILTTALTGEPDIEVVGTAPDPYVARDKILRLRPDVLTLDVEMPRMDGLTFLRKLMQAYPLPVIIISSIAQGGSSAAITALAEGAVEVLAKPAGPYSVGEFGATLAQKIRAAAAVRLAKRAPAASAPAAAVRPPTPAVVSSGPPRLRLIAIGASTGGTEAIERILVNLPAASPPIAIVQHIPAGFSRAFAERLNKLCAIEVREAADGDILTPGKALVAAGNFHLRLKREGGQFRAEVAGGPQVCYQRPAVDVMFESIAEGGASGMAGVLLTGMGSDGAQGLLALRRAGAHTIAQDERSCAVFGMPREAIARGAAVEVLPLSAIAGRLIGLSHQPAENAGRGTISSSSPGCVIR